MVSLLQVLDNPARDVSLAAVLLSPVFPFDCDDLARLALDSKQGSLYRALLREAEGIPLTRKRLRRLSGCWISCAEKARSAESAP